MALECTEYVSRFKLLIMATHAVTMNDGSLIYSRAVVKAKCSLSIALYNQRD